MLVDSHLRSPIAGNSRALSTALGTVLACMAKFVLRHHEQWGEGFLRSDSQPVGKHRREAAQEAFLGLSRCFARPSAVAACGALIASCINSYLCFTVLGLWKCGSQTTRACRGAKHAVCTGRCPEVTLGQLCS
jgi:hypothetical protein